ncbi:DNA-binding transcriptional regulator, LysR family [Halopseudomonas sabulinigri]|uniref:DNA-binding transcriptional regulator, LysR family n=1 Tax=Halopseudomonas sabulinigri TaxID=472181 RepID=A0A1H1VCZ3_9GAMM|nr:LysR family transcriptional regulator [Halopseudomonas sabulinigri]SDS82059.1 DNA-binding transcriptional regulator, LysR family [Halopseudomonas sabulinigri]
MDIKTLQFLSAVVEAGSMSSAARRLGTSRSHVSRRLKALEQSMQVQLFRRTTRRVEPTQIGWALYEHAARISQELAALQATVDDLGQNLRGHIRLSVPVALGQQVVGPLLLEFAALYPEVSLQLTFSNRIFDLVAAEIDVAIRVTSTPPDTLVARDLGPVDWALCASPAYLQQHGTPQQPDDLLQLDMVSVNLPEQRLPLELFDGRQTRTLTLRPRLQTEDMLFLKRAALAGIGCALLPLYSVQQELDSGELIRLLLDQRVRVSAWGDQLYLLTAPNLYPTLATRTLIEFLHSRLRSELPV